MIRELVKYKLDKEKILEYFRWNLKDLNILSKEVVENTPFDKGEFYTLMPKGLSEEQVHSFRGGCVKSHGIQEGVCDFIYKKQKSNSALFCIFDALYEEYDSDFGIGDDLFSKISVHNNCKEIYLAVLDGGFYVSLLQKCFQMTDCIWHSQRRP
ncbi:MAG: hypothetical protein SP4CHLAM5_01930 [Chlamydiia bacterium]|nr:hypothetical protein [Chlamydiia bacterium]MCH9618067.1 hypothetical protein [Chlamydiia bacterium]MCH9624213.1 hypothetical protein [Chlamydiia bacterium]